ncbi:MAG: acylneuraminate cytidylyltransferase family protein [Dehalococcoidia bacterium]
MTEILAIIPARRGSKGLPMKNIKMVNGHPLISYSIQAALESKSINRIICSTDSKNIGNIAQQYGAEVPFLRPKELAQDDTTDLETFYGLLTELRDRENYNPEIIVQLRPTCPIRLRGQIDDAIDLIKNNQKVDSVRSVALTKEHPYKMFKIKDEILYPLLESKDLKEPYNMPRQQLPEAWWHTGTIDITRAKNIYSGTMTGKVIKPYIIDAKHAVDIDHIGSIYEAERIIQLIDCIKP